MGEQHSPFPSLSQRKLHRFGVGNAARAEAAHVAHMAHRTAGRAAHQSRNCVEDKNLINHLFISQKSPTHSSAIRYNSLWSCVKQILFTRTQELNNKRYLGLDRT